jgi:hypothetical protein
VGPRRLAVHLLGLGRQIAFGMIPTRPINHFPDGQLAF